MENFRQVTFWNTDTLEQNRVLQLFNVRHRMLIRRLYIFVADITTDNNHTTQRPMITGRGGPQSCETSRLSHFLDSQLTDGGEVVSLTRRLPFTPRKNPGTHFC
jgi:pantothenate kinase-related protein Tda10